MRLGRAARTTRWTAARGAGAHAGRSRRPTPGTSTAPSSIAMDALRLPPATPTWARCRAARSAAWRSAACCSERPTCCCSTSRPTTSTPSRSRGWSASCKEFPGTVVAITHDRYFLDNVAGWILELDRGQGIPWEGNYSSWLEQKERGSRRRRSRPPPAAHAPARARVDPDGPAARQAKSKARHGAYERCWPRRRRSARQGREIDIPPGRAWATS
jgi:energy-dependent translational throttle protein EttA